MQVSGAGGLAALAKKGLDEHTLTFDSHKPSRSALNKSLKMSLSRVGGARWARKKGLDEHTLTLDSHKLGRSMLNEKIINSG